MFANRFTAFIDACTLVSTLRRNLLLTLAEAEFFRVRWSVEVLDETERALVKMFTDKGDVQASEKAGRARAGMVKAFEDAMVEDYKHLEGICAGWPDAGDAHVVAAAVKTQAAMIVTENLKDFPSDKLAAINIEAKSADAFLADTIGLDPGRAVAAIRRMRERFRKPEMTAQQLLLEMEGAGLTEAVDALRPYVESL